MKKIPSLKLILPLVFLFLTLSCAFSHLKHEATIDDEVAQLIRNVPSAESYPDAGIINLLDEITNQYFEFRASYRQEGDKIFYRGELIRKALRITPEDYPVYKKLCEGVEKSFKRDVLFKAREADRLN